MATEQAMAQATQQEAEVHSDAASPQTADPPSNSERVQPVGALSRAGRTLWQAALGGMVGMQQRTGKAFNRLVHKGASYQRLSRHEGRTEKAAPAAQQPRLRPAQRLHQLEHRLEDRLDKGRDNTLHFIGVPSKHDFESLQREVADLKRLIQQLQTKVSQQNTETHCEEKRPPVWTVCGLAELE